MEIGAVVPTSLQQQPSLSGRISREELLTGVYNHALAAVNAKAEERLQSGMPPAAVEELDDAETRGIDEAMKIAGEMAAVSPR